MTELTKKEWLEARKKHIGASEVSAILGESPHKGPLDVYLDKTTDTIDEDTKIHLAYGHDVETAIANAYAYKTGRTVENRGATTFHVHPDFPWLAATLDRVAAHPEDGRKGVLELKSEGGYRRRQSGEFITPNGWVDDPPLWHQIQVQTQMACASMDWGSLAGMFPGYDLRYVDMDYDASFFEAIMPELEAFWDRVQRREPPPVESQPRGALRAIKRIWDKDAGTTVTLGHEHMDLANQWEQAKQRARTSKSMAEDFEARLREVMQNATFGALPDGTLLTLKTTARDGYTRVVEATEFRTLRRTRIK